MYFKKTLNFDVSIQKYKVRLVAKGYTQQHRVDDNETFAPAARMDTITALVALLDKSSGNYINLI